jgi:hypothetical protein
MDLENSEDNLQQLRKELGDGVKLFALEPDGDCTEFTTALRRLVKENSSEEEAELRRL